MIPLARILGQQPLVASIAPLIENRYSDSAQIELLTALEASGAPKSYRQHVLKRLIVHHEARDLPLANDVMAHYALLLLPEAPDRRLASSSRVLYRFLDYQLSIEEDRNTLGTAGGTGHRTWEAAVALSEFLVENRKKLGLSGLRILEIGSGTGLVGMVAHRLGARVQCSDGDPRVLEQLVKTLYENNVDAPATQLSWSDADKYTGEPIDLVLGADVLYDSRTFPALVFALQTLQVPAILAIPMRSQATFDEFAGLAGPVEVLATYTSQSPTNHFYLVDGPRIDIVKALPVKPQAEI